MNKVKLNKAELAALDALIASIESHDQIQTGDAASMSFITSVVRVTVQVTRVTFKATPYVVEAVAGSTAQREDLAKLADKSGNLNLQTLIQLRDAAK